MEILNSDAPWNYSEDREIWKAFLASRTGTRLFAKALDSQPALLAKGSDNEIFIRSGEVRGWSAAISTLISLSIPEPKVPDEAPAENYPNLTDDEAWKDKQPTE